MKKFFYFIILFLSFSLNSQITYSQNLYLYGGVKQDIYLGCITCSKYSNESIWNNMGPFGSQYQANSIWNTYGTYGSKYNELSPWNSYSNNPPIVLDQNGKFYGYFSTNKYISNRVKNRWLIEILDNYEWIKQNFSEYVSKLELN